MIYSLTSSQQMLQGACYAHTGDIDNTWKQGKKKQISRRPFDLAKVGNHG